MGIRVLAKPLSKLVRFAKSLGRGFPGVDRCVTIRNRTYRTRLVRGRNEIRSLLAAAWRLLYYLGIARISVA